MNRILWTILVLVLAGSVRVSAEEESTVSGFDPRGRYLMFTAGWARRADTLTATNVAATTATVTTGTITTFTAGTQATGTDTVTRLNAAGAIFYTLTSSTAATVTLTTVSGTLIGSNAAMQLVRLPAATGSGQAIIIGSAGDVGVIVSNALTTADTINGALVTTQLISTARTYLDAGAAKWIAY